MTKRRLLIPLDGSDYSGEILPHIRHLIDPQTYALTLLRVEPPPEGLVAAPPRPVSLAWPQPMHEARRDIALAQHPIYASQADQNTRAATERALLEQAHALQEDGYEVAVEVRYGDPAEEIIDYVRAAGCDLVAMATHGWSGLRQILLGSVAERVLRGLSVPVMLLRPRL